MHADADNPYRSPVDVRPALSRWDAILVMIRRGALVLILCSIPANALLWQHFNALIKVRPLSTAERVERFLAGWTWEQD